MITKKILSLVILLFLTSACATFKNDHEQRDERLDQILNSAFFKSAQIGLSVYDLTSGTQITSRNEELLLRPASNEKILTTGAALLFLGNGYNFKTSLYHSGAFHDSVISGDLFVKGGLDPDFSSRDLDSLVKKIRSSGVKEITGNLYADVSAMDSLFFGEGWMWDDDPASYSPYLSPLCINKNCVRAAYSPSGTGEPSKIELIPSSGFFSIQNSSVTVDTGKSDISVTRNWMSRGNTILVEGRINKNDRPDTVSINVFNPALYFLTLLKEELQKNGIRINGGAGIRKMPEKVFDLCSFSRNIGEVIFNTNKKSDNLNAEMILRSLATVSNKTASAQNGIVFIDSLISLSGLNPKNYRIADGSGLSNYNLLSPKLIIETLKYFHKNERDKFDRLVKSFPLSGTDGTLANRMTDPLLRGKVHGKTGSISGVSNLSGIIESRNNHLVAFSIMIQNFTQSASNARSIQDEICKIIFETN